jgi:N-methylhydantoinase B
MTDKITAEILRCKFDAIVAEMRATLINTACSTTVSEANQCSSALFTESGLLVTIDNPVHLSSMSDTATAIFDYFQYDLGTEDVLLTNDPYGGGTHVQEFTAIAPVSFEDEIVLYVGVRAHMEDVGGDLRGNYNPRATEIWAEGIRCPPIKLYRDGKLLKDTLNTIALNSRNPNAFRLDLEAMMAALKTGQRRIQEQIQSYGIKVVLGAMNWSIDYAESRFSAMLKTWANATHEGSCTLLHDCQDRENLSIKVDMEIKDGRLGLDFSATDDQSLSFVNTTPSLALGYALLPIFAAFNTDIPKNAGSLRCVDMITREGSLLNAKSSTPTGWATAHVGSEIALAVTDALSQFLPDKIANVVGNPLLLYTILRGIRHGYTVEQMDVIDYARFSQGGCSGADGRDGWGMPGISAQTPLPSVELFEAEFGGEIKKLEYVSDSAGAGQWRGGLGTEASISLPVTESGDFYLTACVIPYQQQAGFVGGAAGSENAIRISGSGEEVNVERAYVDQLAGADAELNILTGGGIGWGSPMLRAPELVLSDVLNGLVSLEAAKTDYGVVIDPENLQIDTGKTENLRNQGQ